MASVLLIFLHIWCESKLCKEEMKKKKTERGGCIHDIFPQGQKLSILSGNFRPKWWRIQETVRLPRCSNETQKPAIGSKTMFNMDPSAFPSWWRSDLISPDGKKHRFGVLHHCPRVHPRVLEQRNKSPSLKSSYIIITLDNLENSYSTNSLRSQYLSVTISIHEPNLLSSIPILFECWACQLKTIVYVPRCCTSQFTVNSHSAFTLRFVNTSL